MRFQGTEYETKSHHCNISLTFSILWVSVVFCLSLRLLETSSFYTSMPISDMLRTYLGRHVAETSWIKILFHIQEPQSHSTTSDPVTFTTFSVPLSALFPRYQPWKLHCRYIGSMWISQLCILVSCF